MARPAEFVREEVLDKAMEVFWRTGYSGTSVTDLVKATSLKPGSLYGAFNSKRGLFMEVIDTYTNRGLNNAKTCLNSTENPLDAIHLYFDHFCSDLAADEIGKGCFIINTLLELATEDDEIRIRITDYLNEIEGEFISTLEKAKAAGQISAAKDPASLAKLLMTGIWGMRVMSSTRPDPQAYGAVTSHLLAQLQA
ncbi:TetR/AcrR family transcriptional regulator [Marinobacterium jannaschii]|uniref:TetR/AcrR family transcriptional regulator n=1 Tax=Marinobacterium jannaschii TaxID=64970 RepID=UPI0004804C2E|nr:TetR/AcrR family transcriptional regulator [Marinobacterium jannaschii]